MFESILDPFWSLLLLGSGFVYWLYLQRVKKGLSDLPRHSSVRQADDFRPMVSIIIPCRDEAKHIGAALEDLSRQDYPSDRMKIIVVDDRSQDKTGRIVRSYAKRLQNITVVSIDHCPEDISPKKHALLQGLKKSEGQIVITTDGDCRFRSGWVSSLISCFTPGVGVVAGLTIFDRGRPEPLWQRLQQLDFLSYSVMGAGAIGWGTVFSCNGSNLAIRTATSGEVGEYRDFQRIITGDDTLLVQRIKRKSNWSVRFCTDPDSIVRSWPEETFGEVLHQRFRWASGGLSYSHHAFTMAVTSFIFFSMLFISPFLWLNGLISPLWIVLLHVKIVQDAIFMRRGWRVFGLKPDRLGFLILELIHVPSVLFFGIVGHLWGFSWKGQRFKRTRPAAEDTSGATVKL